MVDIESTEEHVVVVAAAAAAAAVVSPALLKHEMFGGTNMHQSSGNSVVDVDDENDDDVENDDAGSCCAMSEEVMEQKPRVALARRMSFETGLNEVGVNAVRETDVDGAVIVLKRELVSFANLYLFKHLPKFEHAHTHMRFG